MMTVDELKDLFRKDYDRWPHHGIRKDLYAFNLLATLVPGASDMVAAAEHDEIFLDVSLEDLAKNATPWDIERLSQCGVRLDDYSEGLAMFV